jgi:SH3-like domain-containing protein
MKTNRSINLILGVALVVVIIAALLLPPISLLQRLTTAGMETIPATTDSDISDPDGTRVAFPAYGVPASFKAKLTSTPREQFLSGAGGEAAIAAANALAGLPLNPRSPLYTLETTGDEATASIITMEIPNESLPYETLDLYEWTGDQWRFLPNHEVLDAASGRELIISELDGRSMHLVPNAFMAMQTSANPPTAGVVVPADQQLPEAGRDALTQANPYGLTLSSDGSLQGNVAALTSAGGSYGVVPVLRNWGDDGVVRTDLLDNLLISEEIMNNHLNAIEALVVSNNLPGVELDYRGLDPTLSVQFTDFVTRLAERLHTAGRTVALRVETPTQIAEDRWNTGGYDWRALGQVVDTFRIPAPIDPTAYATGGAVEQLLTWAVGEVSRHKIDLVLPARSIEKAGAYLISMGYDEALTPLLGEGRTDTTVLVPGEPVDVSLFNDRVIGDLRFDEAVGMFNYDYRDDAGYQRTIWIENAASIARKLALIGQYNLQGVTLEALLEPSFDPDIWSVVREFLAGQQANRSSDFNVVWTVTGPDGTVTQEERPLNAAAFSLTPPEGEGQVKISAAIADNGKLLASGPALALALATATPTPEPTPEYTPTPAPTPTPDFASVTTGDTVNLRSGPGTGFSTVGQINAGQSARIVGKNQDGSWWEIEGADGATAWVVARLVSTSGPADQVAVSQNIPEAAQVAAAPAAAAAAAPAPAAAAPAPVAAAPKPAGGGSFGYGIQAHMVDNGQAGQVMNVTRNMGFNWVKQQIEWKRFEANQGSIDWGNMDEIVNAAGAAGTNLLFSVVNAPNWARGGAGDLSVGGPPADPNTFASFLGQVAAKYCGTPLKAIEVWNEQNLHYEWGNMTIDPGAYMNLLRPAYRAIKAACPSMYVISGALTPTGAPAPWAMDDFTYLEGMYQQGLKDYADGIGAHPSGFNVPPSATWQDACAVIQRTGNSYAGPCNSPHHSWSFRSTMEGYRNIMAKYGDTNKRVWPTEFGWASGWTGASGYEYANDNDLEEQAAWTVEAYNMMRNWGWVGPAFLWNLNFRVVANGTEKAQWGIVDPGWGPLPAYNALANMPK